MTKFKEKKRVVIFLEPKDYQLLNEWRWKKKEKSVPQVILKIIDKALKQA